MKSLAEHFYFQPFINCKRLLLNPDTKVIGVNFYNADDFDMELIKDLIKIGNKLFVDKRKYIDESGYFSKYHKCWIFEVEMFKKLVIPLLETLNFTVEEIEYPGFGVRRNLALLEK